MEQLATLDAVIEHGSFERAAIALRITPSAVSQRVKALEQAVGRIVVRRTSPATVTAAGTALLRYARQVRLLGDETARELGADDDAWTEVPLAVNAESLDVWFLDLLDHLPASERIALKLFRHDEHRSTEVLRDGEVFAVITVSPEPVQGCTVEPLGSMPYVAGAVPALAERARRDGLASIPAVDFDEQDPLQRMLLDRLGQPAPVARHQLPTTKSFREAVLRGLGWGYLPVATVRDELDRGTIVPVVDDAAETVPLYWQRWNITSRVLDAVTDAVRAAAAAHLDPPERSGAGAR